eukprot:1816827-Alexandrium_andersonii.AAC.1
MLTVSVTAGHNRTQPGIFTSQKHPKCNPQSAQGPSVRQSGNPPCVKCKHPFKRSELELRGPRNGL